MARTRRIRDQRGALSIEFLAVIGVLILVFLIMLQYAVAAHAHRIAQAAAEQALATASAYDGTTTAAEQTGKEYLANLGTDITNPTITATRTPQTASVTITGDVRQLVPFLPVHLSIHLRGPVEHFVDSP